jgi:hypothetical protein
LPDCKILLLFRGHNCGFGKLPHLKKQLQSLVTYGIGLQLIGAEEIFFDETKQAI